MNTGNDIKDPLAGSAHKSRPKALILDNARIITPDKIIKNGTIVVDNGCIMRIGQGDIERNELLAEGRKTKDEGRGTKGERRRTRDEGCEKEKYTILDLKGKYVFPGLINSHEHLGNRYYHIDLKRTFVCSYDWLTAVNGLDKFPNNILSRFYIYCNYPYDLLGCLNPGGERDLKYVLRTLLRKGGRSRVLEINYHYNAFRNLISGTTTIADYHSHHNFKLPIRLIENQIVINSIRWQKFLIPYGYKLTRGKIPFVIDCECGIDEKTKRELEVLNDLGALSSNTVLIHGTGLSKKDIKLIAGRGASVVWCPNNNMFMMGETANVPEMLKANANVAIGTDGVDSGSVNILRELQFAKRKYRELFDEDIESRTLVDMATINGAKAFKVGHQLGSIEEGKIADLLVVPNTGTKDPYDELMKLRERNIELLIFEGEPIYGSPQYMNKFIESDASNSDANKKDMYKSINIHGTTKVIQDTRGRMDEVMQMIRDGEFYDFTKR